jgi:hypothetical protein
MGGHNIDIAKSKLLENRRFIVWEITLELHTFLLILSTAVLAGAVGMIILIAVSVNRC